MKRWYISSMDSTNSTNSFNCIEASNGISGLTMIFVILPFHFLMIKVLLIDLRLALPRHIMTLSLSMSDVLQIGIIFTCIAVIKIFNLGTASGECHILRMILYFNLPVSLAVSSLSLIALSVERYVACIHCFRLHEIFTRKRTILCISFVWIVSVIGGMILVSLMKSSDELISLNGNKLIKALLVIIVFPTTFLLGGIQYRLWTFSRSKLWRVNPGTMIGSDLEMADMRKKHMKISFVASIVVLVYMVSMLPIGCLSLVELINGNISSSNFRTILGGLSFVNNFADPYIYGFGTVDTRKAILKNLRKMKNFLTRQQ